MSRSHRRHSRRDVEDNDNVDGQLTMVRRTPQTLLSSRQQRLGSGGDALAPVQYTKVDPQTHAKHYYHNDGNGTQAYAYYYNSDQDPSFNSRGSNNNMSSHVQTSMCCYTSSSTSSSSNNGSANDVVAAAHRRHIAGEPIVEEPDDDNNNNSSSRALALPREFGDPLAAMPKDVMAMHRQMVSSMASPFGLLGDDFFADPFAVHSRLLQHHRGNGGSGDPFGSFSF